MPTYRAQVAAIAADPNLDDDAAAEQIAALDFPNPDQPVANTIWQALVFGLLGIAVLALIGLGWAILDGNEKTAPDLFVTAFTASLTGLLGLFVTPQS